MCYLIRFEEINEALRGGDDHDAVPALDSVFEKASLSEPAYVFRGVKSNVFDSDDMTGSEFTDNGYTSTSLIETGSTQYGDTVMRISLPKGAKAIYLDKIGPPHEYEMLLDRGSKFKITSDIYNDDEGRREIEAEYIHEQ